ncbi:hypothetical protein HK104_010124 [Borealophlyctis nickersoniae]|nr:hypothetical protein HK104_010124 [Borealophlyctis nickersoniae]
MREEIFKDAGPTRLYILVRSHRSHPARGLIPKQQLKLKLDEENSKMRVMRLRVVCPNDAGSGQADEATSSKAPPSLSGDRWGGNGIEPSAIPGDELAASAPSPTSSCSPSSPMRIAYQDELDSDEDDLDCESEDSNRASPEAGVEPRVGEEDGHDYAKDGDGGERTADVVEEDWIWYQAPVFIEGLQSL